MRFAAEKGDFHAYCLIEAGITEILDEYFLQLTNAEALQRHTTDTGTSSSMELFSSPTKHTQNISGIKVEKTIAACTVVGGVSDNIACIDFGVLSKGKEEKSHSGDDGSVNQSVLYRLKMFSPPPGDEAVFLQNTENFLSAIESNTLYSENTIMKKRVGELSKLLAQCDNDEMDIEERDTRYKIRQKIQRIESLKGAIDNSSTMLNKPSP